MSKHPNARQSANPVDQSTLTVNEKILKECHVLYTDPDKGLIKIAEQFGLKLLPPRKKIVVLLIGNHSAGKSSFINWYIEEHVQKTGVAIETQGFVIVTSGKKRESLTGNATLHLYPHFKPLENISGCHWQFVLLLRGSSLGTLLDFSYCKLPSEGQRSGVVEFLSTEISTSKQKKFSLVTFVDTPGLVDGDMQYPFDVNKAILWLGNVADLVFTFFDPIGQALCKRTLNLVEQLNTTHAEKMRFYLSKADDAGDESDRQRVMMQIVQKLCKRPGLNRTAFDMPTIYIPELNKLASRCVNQIDSVCCDIERTINQTIQSTLNTLERDCEAVLQLLQIRLNEDFKDRSYNFRMSLRAMFLGALATILPLIMILNTVVSMLDPNVLQSMLGHSLADSLLSYLSPVRILWSVVPQHHQLTTLMFMVLVTLALWILTKWSLGLRPTLSRKQQRQYAGMREHVETVVRTRKQQLYREYLQQSVGDHDL